MQSMKRLYGDDQLVKRCAIYDRGQSINEYVKLHGDVIWWVADSVSAVEDA
jgi:hypothetical protein